ncbi:hypothetical protein MD484_g44, partial [Candolleomyces efflorescens]
MFEYVADDQICRDENEGSIIASLIAQLRAEKEGDPEERFIRVLQYYLAGWHIKPKGVKKPYNPVLGEFFRCRYDYSDGSQGFYIAEQEYIITMPNMYARGILFGKMVLELGDTCVAKNEKLGLSCDLEFKTKGFFSGTYNAIAGRLRRNTTDIGEISGRWSHVMDIRNNKTGKKRVLFDAQKDGQNVVPKWVPPEDEQESNESRRLWSQLTKAINAKDMEWATDAKSTVENAQREDRKKREEKGEAHVPTFFEYKDGRWVPKFM